MEMKLFEGMMAGIWPVLLMAVSKVDSSGTGFLLKQTLLSLLVLLVILK